MAGNWGGKREGAGRKPGSRPKCGTLADARQAVAQARATGRKLAKEVADDFMHIFANMAMEVRPVTERERKRGVAANPKADEDKFRMLSAIVLSWVSVLLPYQSARFQQIKLNVGAFDDGPDVGETDALATLERLLDAYAAADEEERRLRAARDEEERRFRDAQTVQDTRVPSEPEPKPSDDGKLVVLRPSGK